MKTLFLSAASLGALVLAGCTVTEGPTEAVVAETPAASETVAEAALIEANEKPVPTSAERLQAALDAQPDDVKVRYDARNPAETLAFFGIEPGMAVVEALPGGGWYTKILMPYLGPDGAIAGAHYPDEIWAKIIPGADDERVAGFIARTAGWQAMATEWAGENGPEVDSFQMTKLSEHGEEISDAYLFIRALHNLHRTEAADGYMSATIAEAYRTLKPGGIVGVVQHRAPESNSDEWADGNAGYLKESLVIAAFEAAGFILEASSDINANPADTPTEEDIVWRLPPALAGTEEGTPERAAMEAIGESDRMTLKFRKPE